VPFARSRSCLATRRPRGRVAHLSLVDGSLCRLERELALVQGAADDDSRRACIFEGQHVRDRRDAAAGDDRDVDGADEPLDGVGPDPFELPLDVHVGKENPGGAQVGVALCGFGRVEPRALGPARDDHLAVFRVEADEDAVGVVLAYRRDDVGVLDGGRAENHPVDAPLQQRNGVLGGPDAPAQLHVDAVVDRVDDRVDGVGVLALALEGAVQIDQVEGTRAGVDPPLGRRHGVAVGLLGAALATDQLDNLSVLHIDRRNDLERREHGRQSGPARRKRVGRQRPAGPHVYTQGWEWTTMSVGLLFLAPLARRLESAMFGRYERQYRLFAQVITAAAVVLTLLWGAVAFDVVAVGSAAASLVATAASVAISAFVVVGILQFLVLANVLERTNQDVATKAAELEQAAEQLEQTAEEIETTATEVETAADVIDEAAEEVEQTAEEVEQSVDEVEQTADEVEQTAEEVEQTADEVEQTADDVEQTAAQTGDDDAVETVTDAKDRTTEVKDKTTEVKDKTSEVKDAATELKDKTTAAKDRTTDVKDKTSDAKQTAESVSEEVEAAKETASEVEETAAEKRERLADAETESVDDET